MSHPADDNARLRTRHRDGVCLTAPASRPVERTAAADTADAQAAQIDLGAITDSVLRSLTVAVPRERVERLLADLLDQEFSSARVSTFLPIFLHKVACETLRREGPGRG